MPTSLQAVVILLCIFTVITDFIEHRVRNALLLASLVIGAGSMVWLQSKANASPAWMALAGLLIGFLVLLPFYAMRWMGAGDVKFFATLGFLLGGKALLPIWIIASVLGGIHAVIVLASRHFVRRSGPGLAVMQAHIVGSPVWQRVLRARGGREGLPYAAYMAIGALITMEFTNLTHW